MLHSKMLPDGFYTFSNFKKLKAKVFSDPAVCISGQKSIKNIGLLFIQPGKYSGSVLLVTGGQQLCVIRHLSRPLIAYRLLRANTITEPTWKVLGEQFRKQWLEVKVLKPSHV